MFVYVCVMQDIVLCKIYRKATSLKVLEQRAAMEEEMKANHAAASPSSPMSSMDTITFCGQQEPMVAPMSFHHMVFKKEEQEVIEDKKDDEPEKSQGVSSSSSLNLPSKKDVLPELQVPKFNMDWTQDPFWTQLNSPWLQNLTPYANILNF